MDMAAGGNVLTGQANDLAVFGDRFALLDVAQGNLVSEADSICDSQGLAVFADLGARRNVASGDSDVVLGAQMHSKLRQRQGGHVVDSSDKKRWLLRHDNEAKAR